jgi:hypothetical protein
VSGEGRKSRPGQIKATETLTATALAALLDCFSSDSGRLMEALHAAAQYARASSMGLIPATEGPMLMSI